MPEPDEPIAELGGEQIRLSAVQHHLPLIDLRRSRIIIAHGIYRIRGGRQVEPCGKDEAQAKN